MENNIYDSRSLTLVGDLSGRL